MQENFIYYTCQGDYTLDYLSSRGYFYSTRDNNYRLIDLVKRHFDCEGIVYYFKVKESYSGELVTSGRGNHIIVLDSNTLSRNRIEFSASKFSKALLICDALCYNKFSINYSGEDAIEQALDSVEKNFGVNYEFFKSFGNEDSDIHVGLIDTIKSKDVIKTIINYRTTYNNELRLGDYIHTA